MKCAPSELTLTGVEPLRRDLVVTVLASGTVHASVWFPLSTAMVAFAHGRSMRLMRRSHKWCVLHVGRSTFDVTNGEATQIAERFAIPFPALPAMVGASSPLSPGATAVAGNPLDARA